MSRRSVAAAALALLKDWLVLLKYVSVVSSAGASLTLAFHNRRRKRKLSSAPESDHAALWSGGPANIVKTRAVSAPNLAMMSFGSTTLFLLLDIFSMPPRLTGRPSSLAVAPTGW